MNTLTRAAAALYNRQTREAGLAARPSFGSLSNSDREQLRREALTVLAAIDVHDLADLLADRLGSRLEPFEDLELSLAIKHSLTGREA